MPVTCTEHTQHGVQVRVIKRTMGTLKTAENPPRKAPSRKAFLCINNFGSRLGFRIALLACIRMCRHTWRPYPRANNLTAPCNAETNSELTLCFSYREGPICSVLFFMFFIYGLLNDTVSSEDCVVLNGRAISEQ